MRFGLDIAQHQLTFEEIVARARFAEEAGFEGAWIFDHFSALYADPAGPCLEAWTLLSALAAHTSTIRLGTLVTGITHRHPSVLATEVVTVDHVSGGRVECGLGAAWNTREHRALGIPFPSTKERMERLEDAIEMFRLLTTGEVVSYRGKHFNLDQARYRPRPIQRPHPPIWIGANGPQLGLPLAGRQADAWHGWEGGYDRKWDIVRRAAEKAGRDPEKILRSTSLSLSEPWDQVEAAFEEAVRHGVGYLIVGWPSEGKARLEAFVDKLMPEMRG
jgi:alkanesulfonate monooxygenase SsuD/methylene tetrahydromethanopterin reductase-like flavin-dependent oxidoreductase (luciferase family)